MNNSPADARLHALLSRGHGTPREILEMDFGAWPPPGASYDADAMLDESWVFKNGPMAEANVLAANKAHELSKASVSKIFSNPPEILADLAVVSKKKNWISCMGHEAVHVLQCRAFTLDAMLDFSTDRTPASKRSGFGPELERLLARHESRAQRVARHAGLISPPGLSNLASESYYLQYKEIQARVHEWMGERVRRGKPLPGGPQELRQAWEFLAGPQAKKRFSWRPRQLTEQVLPRIPQEKHPEFQEKVLPEIYGTLLELYGDPQGRAKMGFSPSPVYARKILHQILRETYGKGETPWPDSQWKRMAGKAEPEKLERLLYFSMLFQHRAAVGPLLEAYQRSAPERHQPFLDHFGKKIPLAFLAKLPQGKKEEKTPFQRSRNGGEELLLAEKGDYAAAPAGTRSAWR